MSEPRGVPSLGPTLHHDWTRRPFAHRPDRVDWDEHLEAPYAFPGTCLDFLAKSADGLEGSLVAARQPSPGPGQRRFRFWHGGQAVVEESFYGWFGPRVQRVRTESFRLLLDRLDAFFVANAASAPVFVLPLSGFARLAVSHGVLETVLDAPVRVAADGLYARTGHVPSLRVYAGYDGARYAASTRKLFYNGAGAAVSVEVVAREVLERLGYDAVHPAVFHRFHRALLGRSPSHLAPGVWPNAFLRGRTSPLAWVARARGRLDVLRRDGLHAALEDALAAWGRRAAQQRHPVPPGGVPYVGRFLSRSRFASLLDALGDRRLAAILDGFLLGYEAASADWFAWAPGTDRAFFCEVKSTGDTLRPSQKASILWCQRTGLLDYRLLELVHAAPTTAVPVRAL